MRIKIYYVPGTPRGAGFSWHIDCGAAEMGDRLGHRIECFSDPRGHHGD